jgi:hypothetical protein
MRKKSAKKDAERDNALFEHGLNYEALFGKWPNIASYSKKKINNIVKYYTKRR